MKFDLNESFIKQYKEDKRKIQILLAKAQSEGNEEIVNKCKRKIEGLDMLINNRMRRKQNEMDN